MWKAICNRWRQLSLSPPFLKVLFAPMLIMFTMILANFSLSNFFLFLIYVIEFIISQCHRIVGFVSTLVAFASYLLLYYLMGYEDLIWKIGWGFSLFLGFAVFFLSMEEYKSYLFREGEKRDKTIAKFKDSLHRLNDKREVEKRSFEEELKELKTQYSSLQKEVEGAQSLVESSRVESEKVLKRNEALSLESLMQHRKIATMKQECAVLSNSLNKVSEELCHTQLLLENAQKPSSMQGEVHVLYKKGEPSKHLQALEKDRDRIKKAYDQMEEDLFSLKRIVCEEEKEEGSDIKVLKAQLVEKRKKLEMEKAQLIDIEREIFITKKQIQEEGTFVY